MSSLWIQFYQFVTNKIKILLWTALRMLKEEDFAYYLLRVFINKSIIEWKQGRIWIQSRMLPFTNCITMNVTFLLTIKHTLNDVGKIQDATTPSNLIFFILSGHLVGWLSCGCRDIYWTHRKLNNIPFSYLSSAPLSPYLYHFESML